MRRGVLDAIVERRQDIPRDDLERFGFAEKPRDVDQQVVVKVDHLQRRLLEMGDVCVDIDHAEHAPCGGTAGG